MIIVTFSFNIQSKRFHFSASEHCKHGKTKRLKFSETLMYTKCKQCYA